MPNPRSIFWRLMRVAFMLWISLLALLGGYAFVADRYLGIHGDKGWLVGFVYFGGLLTACYIFVVLLLIVVFWLIGMAWSGQDENDV
jgi:hypothetical protein